MNVSAYPTHISNTCLPSNNKAKKNPESALQIHDQELKGDHSLAGVCKACSNTTQPKFSLALTKLAFNLVSFGCVDASLLLIRTFLFIFRRSAQSRSTKANPKFFAITQILAVPVQLVCQNGFRVAAIPLFVRLDRIL